MTVDGKNVHLGTFGSKATAARVAREARVARDNGEWKPYHQKLLVGRRKVCRGDSLTSKRHNRLIVFDVDKFPVSSP